MKYDIPGVTAYDLSRIVGEDNIRFGSNIIIDDFAFIYATAPVTIGNYVHIGCFASLAGGATIEIGDFVALSHGSRILSGSDDFVEWGFGNSTVPTKYRNVKRAPIHIGRFSIVGANSVVLPGVTIGEGAMVGANSTISRDLEPWGVYVANGKKVRERDRDRVIRNFEQFCRETGYDPAIR
jgi:galactoside O-acetyltransferase